MAHKSKNEYLRRLIRTKPSLPHGPTGQTAVASDNPSVMQQTMMQPNGASPAAIQSLQRSYGNRALGQAIQRANAEDHPQVQTPTPQQGGIIQREVNKAGQYVDSSLDEAANYLNPKYGQEVDADERRNDGQQKAKKYTSLAGKGVGKFNKTTSNEEFAMVGTKKAAERDDGKPVVHQNSSDLGFLYAQAEMVKDTYETRCHAFANATHGKLSKRPGDGLKGMDRTLEKMNADYNGDASRMADLTGASISFDTPEDLIACYRLIASDHIFKITKLKNSLANAYSYGDINMVVAIGEAEGGVPDEAQPNGRQAYQGFQVELQLHLEPILTQKQAGHKQYEEQRAIEAKEIYAKTKTPHFLKTPNLLPADKKRWEKLQAEMVAIYGVGWKKILDRSEFAKDPQRAAKFKEQMLAAIPPVG